MGLASVLFASAPSSAQGVYDAAQDPDIVTMRQILQQPDADLDLAKIKLSIDKLIDPDIDVAATQRRLDAMAADLRSRLPHGATADVRFEALRHYLYEPGAWNRHKAFRYDFDDPSGHSIRNKLLANYLDSPRGNCISMPFLFLILGKKLGLDVTASVSPRHVFVKYRDTSGVVHNFEATSGGFKSAESFMQESSISPLAIKQGVYLRWLSTREVVALMGEVLLEFYAKRPSNTERTVAMANLLLQHSPLQVDAMLHVAAAYQRDRSDLYESRFSMPAKIPPPLRPHFNEIEAQIVRWHRRAVALGWREPEEASEEQYKLVVQRAKARSR